MLDNIIKYQYTGW